MKHRISGRKLSRAPKHAKAMFRNQLTSLVEHERIETTLAKAKELRRFADKLIRTAKRENLEARRKVNGVLKTDAAAKKVFVDLVPRFATRPGGYTRVLRTRFRRGDCAQMAVIELSDTNRSILTEEQLLRKEQRKSKHRRATQQSRGLAEVLD